MTKLQTLFVALVNIFMDIFQMTLKFSLSLLINKCNFCWNIVSTFLCMQTCRMFAALFSIYTIGITITTRLTTGLPPLRHMISMVITLHQAEVNWSDLWILLYKRQWPWRQMAFTLVKGTAVCSLDLDAYYGPHAYVSLRFGMQNAVSAQPCIGKFRISLVLFNFLHCNFRLWFETP